MRRSTELEQLVHDWFAAASLGDSTIVQRHVSPGAAVRLIGSDPTEWLQGGQDVAGFLTGEVEGGAGNVRFAPSETEAYEEGTVGWAATRLTITLPDGNRVTPDGHRFSIERTTCGSSCSHTHRSAWRTIKSVGSTPDRG